MKCASTDSDFELVESLNLFTTLVDAASNKNSMIANANEYEKYILFHNSLIFHTFCLYVVSFLNKASSVIEK